MSTYLELVRDLQREVGASGSQVGSVTGQQGEAQRLVKWIQQADFWIQNRWLNWKFLWNQVELTTVIGSVGLAAPTDLNFWDYKTFKINDTGDLDDDEPLSAIEHDQIKWQVRDFDQGKPSFTIIMPDNSLEFEPVPDENYIIKADYFRTPIMLTANDQVSRIPENYHQAILGRAMILYANYENSPEIKTQGQEIFDTFLARLENSQLPNQRYARYQSTGSFFDVNAQQDGGSGFAVGSDGSW